MMVLDIINKNKKREEKHLKNDNSQNEKSKPKHTKSYRDDKGRYNVSNILILCLKDSYLYL